MAREDGGRYDVAWVHWDRCVGWHSVFQRRDYKVSARWLAQPTRHPRRHGTSQKPGCAYGLTVRPLKQSRRQTTGVLCMAYLGKWERTKALIEDDEILHAASLPLRLVCLETAAKLTAGDRNKTYGEPVANMQHIADIFNAWTGRDITAREVAQMHQATKMARSQTSPTHQDSYVDAMAYRGIEMECAVHAAEQSQDNGNS